MKKHILTFGLLIFANNAYSQVAIGKQDITNNNVLLDFDDNSDNSRGIILPTVTNSSITNPTNGTFVFDESLKKVRMYENNSWRDLTGVGNDLFLIKNNANEIPSSQGVIIGAETSSVDGVLILESDDKAMVLPKIANPHLSVKSPYPGMMCYDTVSKSLAVFDGANWNYWK